MPVSPKRPEETGRSVEEIAEAVGSQGREAALRIFLASCRTVAETQNDPGFLYRAELVVETVRQSAE